MYYSDKTNHVKFYYTDEHAKIAQIHLSSQCTAVNESAIRL